MKSISQLVKRILKRNGLELIRHSAYRKFREDPYFAQDKIFDVYSQPKLIFDVGAFNGSISLKYNKMFPEARIISAEPFPESFSELEQNTQSVSTITPIKKAFADFTGEAEFSSNIYSQTNSLLPTHQQAFDNWKGDLLKTKDRIIVDTVKLDEFAQANGLSQIDILKLDVQGAEMKVLQGSENLLRMQRISLIYTEIITTPTYVNQTSLDEMISFLKSKEFHLFNIYNPSYTDLAQLRQVDAIFLSDQILNSLREKT